MPLAYTKITKKTRRSVFVVTFFFEHGDADKRTTDTMDVHLSKDEMVHYLAKVSDISELITDSSSSGYSLPDGFENTANYNGVPILLERDCFYRECGSTYYASMDVERIVYFDENGEEFAVENTR